MKAKVLTTFVSAACSFYEIPEKLIYSDCRERPVKDLRHALCYVIKTQNQSMSLSEVARVFNKTDHSTVIHSINACRDFMKNEPDYFFMVTHLEEMYARINKSAMISQLMQLENELKKYEHQAV